MMAELAFQRLVAGPMKFAQAIDKKRAPFLRELLEGDVTLTTLECRREDGKGSFRGHLQHHTVPVARLYGSGGFIDGPPSGSFAVVGAGLATARL